MIDYAQNLEQFKNESLQSQIAQLDSKEMTKAIEECIVNKGATLPQEYEPASYFSLEPEDEEKKALYKKAVVAGLEAVKAGKVAAFTVAGGQGTRLGYDGPKGTLPVSPVKQKSLFELFADQLKGLADKHSVAIPWYIMCSPLNIAATESFFNENDFFGLSSADVNFFEQGVMPAVDFEGSLLRASEESLALSPNGHGGSLKALIDSGAIADMKSRGIEHVSYFQVDNPLISILNPLFVGLHVLNESDMSSRSLTKVGPFEKLGNFVIANEKMTIIEYSDLPDEKAEEVDAEGRLRYRAGSPAIHIIRRDFIEKFADASLSLPYHRAEKKVPYLNSTGEKIVPEVANAVKFETFIFDALPLAQNSIILEADREEEFSPVKNKTGVDSLESSQKDQVAKAARWLKAAGYSVEDGALIELSARYSSPSELQSAIVPGRLLSGESYFID